MHVLTYFTSRGKPLPLSQICTDLGRRLYQVTSPHGKATKNDANDSS